MMPYVIGRMPFPPAAARSAAAYSCWTAAPSEACTDPSTPRNLRAKLTLKSKTCKPAHKAGPLGDEPRQKDGRLDVLNRSLVIRLRHAKEPGSGSSSWLRGDLSPRRDSTLVTLQVLCKAEPRRCKMR